MAKGLSAAKAKKILQDGYIKGKPLTAKQKKYFGAIASGATPLKAINGAEVEKAQWGKILKTVKNLYKGADKFESSIDWAKWNKAIPENKALIKEYNAIEEATKKNGTWMKNSDGSAFNGTPEQFVQQNSKNFKKAFPDGFTKGYRGAKHHIDDFVNRDRNDWATFLTDSKENAVTYAGSDGVPKTYFHPDVDKQLKIENGLYPPQVNGVYELGFPNNLPTVTGNANGKSWRLLDYDSTIEQGIKLDGRVGDHQQSLLNWTEEGFADDYGLQGFNPSARYLTTDNYASYVKNKANKEAVAKIKNVKDQMGYSDILANTVFAVDAERVPLKSLRHNNGMFDMTNSNIYKAIVPGAIGAGAASEMIGPTQADGQFKNGGWLDKFAMGGSLPGASGMMYSRNSGSSAMSPPNLTKAQDGTVEYGTPEYKKAYEEGTFADVPNQLDEVVIDSGVDYEKDIYYDTLTEQEKDLYHNDYSPIGTAVRRKAQTKRGLAEDTYDVVNPLMYGMLGLAGGMMAGPSIATLGRAAAPYASRYLLNPIQRALSYKPLGGPVSIGNTIDAGSAAYAAYATPEAYDKFKENPSWDTGLDLGLTAMDLVPFSEIFTGGKNIRKAYNYASDKVSTLFRGIPQNANIPTGINLETTPLRDAVTQPNIWPTSSPLPKNMEPYVSKKIYPFNKEQEVFESFLSTDKRLENIDSKSLYYDQAGKPITKSEADNLLYPPEYQKNGGDVDKAQWGKILKTAKNLYKGFKSSSNVVEPILESGITARRLAGDQLYNTHRYSAQQLNQLLEESREFLKNTSTEGYENSAKFKDEVLRKIEKLEPGIKKDLALQEIAKRSGRTVGDDTGTWMAKSYIDAPSNDQLGHVTTSNNLWDMVFKSDGKMIPYSNSETLYFNRGGAGQLARVRMMAPENQGGGINLIFDNNSLKKSGILPDTSGGELTISQDVSLKHLYPEAKVRAKDMLLNEAELRGVEITDDLVKSIDDYLQINKNKEGGSTPKAQVGDKVASIASQMEVNEEDGGRPPLGVVDHIRALFDEEGLCRDNTCVQTVKDFYSKAGVEAMPKDVYNNREFLKNFKEYGFEEILDQKNLQPGDVLQYYYGPDSEDVKEDPSYLNFPYHMGVYVNPGEYIGDGDSEAPIQRKNMYTGTKDGKEYKKDPFRAFRYIKQNKNGSDVEKAQWGKLLKLAKKYGNKVYEMYKGTDKVVDAASTTGKLKYMDELSSKAKKDVYEQNYEALTKTDKETRNLGKPHIAQEEYGEGWKYSDQVDFNNPEEVAAHRKRWIASQKKGNLINDNRRFPFFDETSDIFSDLSRKDLSGSIRDGLSKRFGAIGNTYTTGYGHRGLDYETNYLNDYFKNYKVGLPDGSTVPYGKLDGSVEIDPSSFNSSDEVMEELRRLAQIRMGDQFNNAFEKTSRIDFGDLLKNKNRNGGWLSKYENGGVIEDDRGQWAHPGEVTKINSNNITMKGVNYPVLGVSDTGDTKMMQPGVDNYKYDGNSVTEYPMAQEGAGVNKEGVKQYKWFKNYMRSPKYKERLKKEFPDYSDNQIGQEVKSRLENVMQTRVGFLPRSSDISTGVGGVQGVYNADEYPGAIMLRPEYSASTSDALFKPGNYLSGYNTIPLHEWSHAADDGGNRMPQSTTDLMLSKMKENSLGISKDKYYYTRPTEYLGRMQPLRYLMQQEGLYDAGTQDFTKEDLENAKQNKTIKNNQHFQDLMENVKSDEDFIELMNKVASVNQKDNSRTMMAKDGKSLVALDQLTNFTNYNTPQPGGWLDKY